MAAAVTIHLDDLRKIVREAVREELGAHAEPAEIMTREQVASLLQVHEMVVTRYVRTRGLPGRKLAGNEWRFLRSEVMAWVEGKTDGRR